MEAAAKDLRACPTLTLQWDIKRVASPALEKVMIACGVLGVSAAVKASLANTLLALF
jgi:hypothetical protein